MPAVSTKVTVCLPRRISSATESRVVPGMSDTMTLGYLSRAFIREDLPTLGAPAITTVTPRCNRAVASRRHGRYRRCAQRRQVFSDERPAQVSQSHGVGHPRNDP